jgi:predicted LPLAT superfamily acyltransferase
VKEKMPTPDTEAQPELTPKWDGQSKGPRLGNLIFMKLISWFGVAPAYALLKFVAFWYAMKDDAVTRSVKSFYRHTGVNPRFIHIYRHIVSFGRSLIDANAFLCGRGRKWQFICDGEDHISAALKKGKGLILVSAHIGNMEIAGNLLSDHIKARVNFLMFDRETRQMREVFRKALERRRVDIVPVSEDPLEMMLKVKKVLSNNEILCITGDRVSGREESIALPFLGGRARFPIGPFMLGAITGAPLIAVFSLRQGNDGFLFKVFASISFDGVKRTERKTAVEKAAGRYVEILEEVVRKYPSQWFNMYDYWES